MTTIRSLGVASVLLVASLAWGEPPDRAVGGAGFVREIEAPAAGGGTDSIEDADAAQGREALEGSPDPSLSRRAVREVEEIVVRARRRAELLEDTPISITAVSAATLRETGVTRLDEVQDLVPNLTFSSFRSDNDFQVFIRGVGQRSEEIEPGVGIYVDGVYLPRAGNSILNVIDIAQVEVLRGPQGTLFGKNTTGGAINITSVRPTEDLEGFAFVRPSNFGTIDTRFTLNVPIRIGALTDKVFTRFSFASTNSDGFTENLLPGREETYNNRNALWTLGSVRVLPHPDVEINVSGNWFRDQAKGRGGQCVFVQRPPDPAVRGLLEASFPDFQDNCRASEEYRFRSENSGIAWPSDYGVWGDVGWRVGEAGPLDDLDFKVIGSWREQELTFRLDPEMTQDRVVVLSGLGSADPLAGEPRTGRQISVEGQVTGRALDARLAFVAGAYGYWEHRFQQTATRALEGTVGDLFGGTLIAQIDQNDQDWALFGQATYDPLVWMSLTAGIRYTDSTREVERFTVNPYGTPEMPGVPTVVLPRVTDSLEEDAWTPMASLSLRAPDDWLADTPVDHLMAYFTWSRGFKAGGFNQLSFSSTDPQQTIVPYGSEEVESYELGAKTIAFGDRFVLNTSFFLWDYTDMQVQQVVTIPGEGNNLPVVEFATLNAASATGKGFEIETIAVPADRLTLTGSVAVLDAKFDQFDSRSELDSNDEVDRAGERFGEVPAFTSYVSLLYSRPVEIDGPRWLQGWLTPRLDWAYRSSVRYLPPEVPQAEQRGVNLLHARLSYDFLDDRAQVALWAKNLLDESVFSSTVSLVSIFGVLTRYYDPPRTFGGELSFRF